MRTKDETAQWLAQVHYQLDPTITRIFRVVEDDEANDLRPLKLLEVSTDTPEVGISPVGMPPAPERGLYHKTVIIDVSPSEFDRLRRGELSLPHDWRLEREIFRPAVRSAS